MFNFNHSKRGLFILIFILISGISFGQTIKEQFEHNEFTDNFNVDNGLWPIFTNADNLFVIQTGEYILNRRNNSTQYASILNWENQLESFELKVNLKLDKVADDNGSIGIIFMAHSTGAFIVEYNRHKQYRVKQLIGTTYRYLTGEESKEGWVKSSDLNPIGSYNLLDIKTIGGKYDVYFNGIFQISFTEKSYTYGKMGIIIGPATNAIVDKFFIYSNKKIKAIDTSMNKELMLKKIDTANSTDISADVINALTETVVRLKTQINKLTSENDDLKRQIATLGNISNTPKVDKSDTEKVQMAKVIKILENQLILTNGSIDSIKRLLTNYRNIQQAMEGNENADIIITLTNMLKSEKVTNELLIKTNNNLTDSLNYYKSVNNILNPPNQPIKTPEKNKASTDLIPENKTPTDSTGIKNNQNDPNPPKH